MTRPTKGAEGRRNPHWFAQVIDNALDAVIAMDTGGRIIEWNKQAEVAFGWSRDEAMSVPLASLIVPKELRAAHAAGLARFLTTGEGAFLNNRVEVTALHRDGSVFPIELAITPTRFAGQTIFTAFVRDISIRKRHEAWLKRRVSEAEFLYQATALAAESDSFEDALRGCIEMVCQVTGWPIGHALVPDRDDSALITTGIWYGDADAVATMKTATGDTRFTDGVGLPGRIWHSGEPLWIAVARNGDPGFPRAGPAGVLGINSAFGFPIKIKERVVAVLEFFTFEDREPEAQLLLLARTIGAQVGRLVERRMAEQHRQILLNELAHRVKNTLAVVSAIANQTLRTSKSPEAFTQSFQARLQALASAHDLLTAGHWERADLRAIVESGVAVHRASGEGVELHGAPLAVPPKAALALSLVFHELGTNAAKYGALSSPGGKVIITWEADDTGRLRIDWRESGGPRITQPPESEGYGSTLIRISIERDLGGDMNMHYLPEGLHCEIHLPLNPSATEISATEQPPL